jgi:hypothetical protein
MEEGEMEEEGAMDEGGKEGGAAKEGPGRRTPRGKGNSAHGFVRVKLRRRGRNFPSSKRLGVSIRSCWRGVFSIFLKNED